MTSRVTSRLVVIIVLLAAVATVSSGQTYTDVREVEDTGDIIGTELELVLNDRAATGILRHYEGTEPEEISVAGRLVGNVLTMSGTYSEGKVEIDARIEQGWLRGKLLYRLDGQTNEVQLNLPRVDRRRREKD